MWDEPDRFDIRRRLTHQVGYGTGIHGCVAQMMARLEGEVFFRALAERYDATGGDIRNAVLKAALAAASENGARAGKAIRQRHLEDGIREVLESKRVMRQSLIEPAGDGAVTAAMQTVQSMYASLHRGLVVAGVLAVIAIVIAAVALAIALMSGAPAG